MPDARTRILFLCTGNSCRSQMAEGWTRFLHGDTIEVHSAGIQRHGLNPLARLVMAEQGVDISHQRSKLIDELPRQDFDWVITVCDHARQSCPVFPSTSQCMHHAFPDPPELAQNADTKEAELECYRQVCDEIRDFILHLPRLLDRF